MKTLLLTFLTLALISSARGGQQERTANELLKNVRAELPKGWSATYDKEYSWLEVSRDEAVSSMSGLPNSPLYEKPERRIFRFAFRVMPAVSPDEYHRWSTENAKIQKQATALYEDLVKRRVSQKFDSFMPRTDSERTDVARYEALKASLHILPDFYFHDISLRWQLGSPGAHAIIITEDKIRDECTRVQKRVMKLLSKYDA